MISPPARVTRAATICTEATSLRKWTEPSTNRALAPAGVERVDLVVAGAVDHAGAAADAVLPALGAGQAGVGEVVGPGPAAAADRLDDAVDRQAVDLRLVDLPESVVADRLGAALRDHHGVRGAVGDRRQPDLAGDRPAGDRAGVLPLADRGDVGRGSSRRPGAAVL